MADVTVTTQQIARSGLAPSYTGSLSTSNSYFVSNDGLVFLHLKKSGAGACTVTVETTKTSLGLALADLTATVPATTGDIMLGLFPPDTFNDSSGRLKFTVSEVTGLTVAAIHP